MQTVVKKMIAEAMAAQHADVNQIKKKRGTKFVIGDTKAYADAVKGMKPAGNQSKAVFALHKDSVDAHYTILKGLTSTIRPEDDPFVETLPDAGDHGDPVRRGPGVQEER